jgi:hypothetical protein
MKDKMDGICNTHGEGEKSPPKFYLENLKRRDRSGNLVVHRRIILTSILNEWCDGVDWIYLNVRDHVNETTDSIKAGNCLHQVSDCKLPNDCAPLNKYVIGNACGCLIPCSESGCDTFLRNVNRLLRFTYPHQNMSGLTG